MTDHPGLLEQRANVEGVLRVVQRSTGDQAIADAADALESLAAFAQPPASGVDREGACPVCGPSSVFGKHNLDSKGHPVCGAALTNSGAPVPGWQDISTAPREGFFLVWGPHNPELSFPYEGERFWKAQDPSWPAHLSSRCFTLWHPMLLPETENR